MWARAGETMLGLWLAMSPFLFGHTQTGFWINDLVCGFLLCLFSLASRSRRIPRARGLTAAVGLWLAAWGRFSDTPPLPPALQNDLIVGLLVLMVVVIPNEASQPPPPWRQPDIHRGAS